MGFDIERGPILTEETLTCAGLSAVDRNPKFIEVMSLALRTTCSRQTEGKDQSRPLPARVVNSCISVSIGNWNKSN